MSDVAALTAFTHDEAMGLLVGELERTVRSLRALDGSEWGAATDCPAWDVRAMYQHVLGACEAGASVRENVHQLRRARAYRAAHGGPMEAALSHIQVSERETLSGPEIVERLAQVAPKTVSGRRRVPALVRNHASLKVDGPVTERWKLGYLIDTIYLRDLWMHRVDSARATGRPVELSSQHDGRIVADVVGEWARRHGARFRLELTGPAGGAYSHGPEESDAEHITLDAVEFCRSLAGRAPAIGLLATIVPF